MDHNNNNISRDRIRCTPHIKKTPVVAYPVRYQVYNGDVSMKFSKTLLTGILVAALIFIICPIHAESSNDETILYQSSFSSDPGWKTNNPSSDFWDPSKGMYHFGIEPATGNYAYHTLTTEYDRGSFTLEYDLLLERVDDDASFRLGFSGTEMDRSKGPNVLTEFTNAKYGQIFWLRTVTGGAKLTEVNSHSSSYGGPTVNYALNTTYHIVVTYDDDTKTVTERVTDKTSSRTVWSYYINTYEQIRGMNRIYVGSIGDYSTSNRNAVGYVDNIKLYTVGTGISTPTGEPTVPASIAPTYSKRPTTMSTTISTPVQTTPASSPSLIVAIGALGVVGACMGIRRMRKNR